MGHREYRASPSDEDDEQYAAEDGAGWESDGHISDEESFLSARTNRTW
jgi:hypothetical protein